MMRTLLFVLCLLSTAHAENEVWWTKQIASETGWDAEVVLPDRSRPDLVSETTAWEVEWCEKWKESFGQAMFYSAMMDKRPGIYLLIKPGDELHFLRFQLTLEKLQAKFPELEVRWRKVSDPVPDPYLPSPQKPAPQPVPEPRGGVVPSGIPDDGIPFYGAS